MLTRDLVRWALMDGYSATKQAVRIATTRLRKLAVVHIDCLKLFTRTFTDCNALDRLWLAAVWSKPFANMRTPEPPRRTPARNVSSFAPAAGKFGLSQAKTLSFELQKMILELLQLSQFWRYVNTLQFSWRLLSEPSEPLITIPLSCLSSWERGSPPELVNEGAALPLRIIRHDD